MHKKLWLLLPIGLVVALLAGFWFFLDVSAQSGDDVPTISPHWRITLRNLGQVVSIAEDQFVVRRRSGQEFTVSVIETTKYKMFDGSDASFDDLDIDRWVLIALKREDTETFVARAVLILGPDFSPNEFLVATGKIISIDKTLNWFTVEHNQGKTSAFKVDADTRYRAEVDQWVELETGMSAFVVGRSQEGSEALAKVVWAGMPTITAKRQVFAGQIIDINLEESTFRVQLWRGRQILTFRVDDATHYTGRDGAIENLADLQGDMVCLVYALRATDGTYLARRVASTSGDQLPIFDAKALGKVVSVDQQGFVLEIRSGKQFQIQANGSTAFRSRVAGVDSFDDLEAGMIVAVGGKPLGQGRFQYQADLVIVLSE